MDISAKFESISLLSIPSDQRAQTLATAVAVAMCHRVADGYDFETDVKPLLLRVCGLMRPIGEVLVDDCIDRYRRMYNAYFQYTRHHATQLRVMTTGTTPYPDLDEDISIGLNNVSSVPGLFELINYAFNKASEQTQAIETANDDMETFVISGEAELEVEIALESSQPNIIVRIWNWIVEQIKAFGRWIAKVWDGFWNWITGNKKSSEVAVQKVDKVIEQKHDGAVKAVVAVDNAPAAQSETSKRVSVVKQQVNVLNVTGETISKDAKIPEKRPVPEEVSTKIVISDETELLAAGKALWSKHQAWVKTLDSLAKDINGSALRPLFNPKQGRGEFYTDMLRNGEIDEYVKNVFETELSPKTLGGLKQLVDKIPFLIKGCLALEADPNYQAILTYKGLSVTAPVNADRILSLFQTDIKITVGNDSTDILAWMWTLIPSIKAHRSLTDIFNLPKLPDVPLVIPNELVDDINFFNALPNVSIGEGSNQWKPGQTYPNTKADLDTWVAHTTLFTKYTGDKKGLLALIDKETFTLKHGSTLNISTVELAGTHENSTYAAFRQVDTLKSKLGIDDALSKMQQGDPSKMTQEEVEVHQTYVSNKLKVSSEYYAAYLKYQTWLAKLVFDHGRAFNQWIMSL